ncbi:hypothetical protein SEA_JONJAMES_122 [Gordonia Phage JonJames]|nr:hypothetical protein SEA_JONJAMES_122 [Gordonia Phage JonJames]
MAKSYTEEQIVDAVHWLIYKGMQHQADRLLEVYVGSGCQEYISLDQTMARFVEHSIRDKKIEEERLRSAMSFSEAEHWVYDASQGGPYLDDIINHARKQECYKDWQLVIARYALLDHPDTHHPIRQGNWEIEWLDEIMTWGGEVHHRANPIAKSMISGKSVHGSRFERERKKWRHLSAYHRDFAAWYSSPYKWDRKYFESIAPEKDRKEWNERATLESKQAISAAKVIQSQKDALSKPNSPTTAEQLNHLKYELLRKPNPIPIFPDTSAFKKAILSDPGAIWSIDKPYGTCKCCEKKGELLNPEQLCGKCEVMVESYITEEGRIAQSFHNPPGPMPRLANMTPETLKLYNAFKENARPTPYAQNLYEKDFRDAAIHFADESHDGSNVKDCHFCELQTTWMRWDHYGPNGAMVRAFDEWCTDIGIDCTPEVKAEHKRMAKELDQKNELAHIEAMEDVVARTNPVELDSSGKPLPDAFRKPPEKEVETEVDTYVSTAELDRARFDEGFFSQQSKVKFRSSVMGFITTGILYFGSAVTELWATPVTMGAGGAGLAASAALFLQAEKKSTGVSRSTPPSHRRRGQVQPRPAQIDGAV